MRWRRALERWLRDPAAQIEGRAATVDAARASAAMPALAAFRAALAIAPPGLAGAEAADDAVAALLADTGWCAELVAGLIDRLRADPFFVPPQQALDNGLHAGLVVHDDVHVTVALGVGAVDALAARKTADRGPRALILSGRRGRIRFLRGGGATIAFHVLDATGRLVPGDRHRLKDGDGFAIDGRRATWIVDHAAADLVLVQATLKQDGGPLMREFDPATGREIACSTTDEAASRTQLLVSLLGAMDRRDAIPAIAECLRHEAAFVRWHAMRELVGMDGEDALPDLMGLAASDPDPALRDTARRTLALLRSGAPCLA